MARQITMEAALKAFETKCADLLRSNVLLECQLAEVERENKQLREQAGMPAEPEPGGQPG